jgi:hypothetical protein
VTASASPLRRALPRLALAAALSLGLALPAAVRAAPARPAAAAKLGIRITALRITAGGYMIDVRYRVSDPARAKAFLAQKSKDIFLVDEATGARLGVPNTPKLGTLRQRANGDVKTDRDYFVMFANPGRRLQPGAKVTLVAGGERIRHLAVE